MKENIIDRDRCKKCESTSIIFVQYTQGSPEAYDGVSEVLCQECGTRFGRWSGKELAEGEIEKRHGRRK